MVQAQAPVLPPSWYPNREPSVDAQRVSFCEDPREPAHEVDRTIAEAVAAALLVEPRIHVVERQVVVEQEYEGLYLDLIDRCAVYLGFKLYANTYPGWLTLTRPYYEARFVVLTPNQEWRSLNDVSRDATIGAVQGSMGDIRFLTLNNARPAAERWRRAPVGRPERAFDALLGGVVDALVVWEPWWWSLRLERPELADLRVLEAPEVSEPWIGVGGITLADRAFVRSNVDEAIAVLAADGTIQQILESFDFPGRAVP